MLTWDVPYAGDTVEDVMQWVATNIEYRTDQEVYGERSYWASPGEVWINRAGDCEDFCILALYLLHRDLGIDGEMMIGYPEGGTGHTWLVIDGVQWAPMLGRPYDHGALGYTRIAVLNYHQVMRRLD